MYSKHYHIIAMT